MPLHAMLRYRNKPYSIRQSQQCPVATGSACSKSQEATMRREVAVESTAEAYLELLAARGIDYFFANGGTDFGPIVEAYAKRLAGELPVPRPVTVPHEITAVAMAHGYTMVTGRPQVVMVHTIAGTANAVGGLINASRTQIPMLFTAGRRPRPRA